MGHRPVSPPAILSSPSSSRLHLLLLLLLLFLPLTSSGRSFWSRNPTQCKVPHYLPGFNLLGESVDRVTYERKERVHPVDTSTFLSPRGKCFLYQNPHLGNQLQKVPFSVRVETVQTDCQPEVNGDVHSVTSLIETVKSKDIDDWKVGLDWKMYGLKVGGQHYDSYDFAKSRNLKDHYTFSSHFHRCSFYRLTVRPKRLLNKGFKDDVKNLPRSYNSATKDKYREFIHKYGTDYIYQVTLGGQVTRVAATRTCLSRLNNVDDNKAQRCLSLDLEAGMGMGALDPGCYNFIHNWNMRGRYSAGLYDEETKATGGNGWSGLVSSKHPDAEGYRRWKESLKSKPAIVKFFTRPLSDLVDDEAKGGLIDAINEYRRDTKITVLVRKWSCSGANHYSDCCPRQFGKGWLKVTIIRALDVYGDVGSRAEAFVETSYEEHFRRTETIHSNNPRWDKTYYLGLVDAGQKLTLELKEKDPTRIETLFSCSRNVKVGSHPVTCRHKYGTLLAEYELDCGPHLTGDYCDVYDKYREMSIDSVR